MAIYQGNNLVANVGGVPDIGGGVFPDFSKAEYIWEDVVLSTTTTMTNSSSWYANRDGFILANFTGVGPSGNIEINDTVFPSTETRSVDSTTGAYPTGVSNSRWGEIYSSNILPITKGDKIIVTASSIRRSTTTYDYINRLLFFPIKTRIIPTAEEFSFLPDYANKESINRINTNGGTWTVDRDGFVNYTLINSGSGDGKVTVDGVDVAWSTDYAASQLRLFTGIVPVRKGNVVTITSSAFTSCKCYYIPPITIIPPIAKEFQFLPDYSNIEATTNLIYTNGGTWTVDRDGFITYYIYATNLSGTTYATHVIINNIKVESSLTNAGSVLVKRGTVPVKMGDIVELQLTDNTGSLISLGTGSMSCYFIPPVIGVPATAQEVAFVPDYSAIEDINRLSYSVTSWTCEKDGFVRLRGTTYCKSQGNNAKITYIYINNKLAMSDSAYASTWTGWLYSSQIVPIKKGDVVSFTSEISQTDTYIIECFFIPPRIVIPPTATQYAFIPNYSATETINRISTNNGTWTVDRDGFVLCAINQSATGTGYVYVNDQIVAGSGINYLQTHRVVSTIVPVRQGDVVKLTSTAFSSGTCYYVPPVDVTPPLINNAYSTTEILTGKRWLNGKNIYRKCFEGTITATANAWGVEDLISSGVEDLIASGGYWESDSTKSQLFFPSIASGAADRKYANIINYSGNVKLNTISNEARTNALYRIWVEYTKG